VTSGAVPVAAARARSLAARVTDTVGLRLLAGGLAVVVAYHYTLLTLARDLGLDTPLAYLGLVPPMAVGIAVLTPKTEGEPEIHDRQVDLIVGFPLLAVALFLQATLPDRLGSDFWLYRIDLLTMPLFVAGCVVLLFGVRALWRFRVAVAFLFLAWPVPYAWFIDHFLGLTTGTTISGLKASLHLLHVATPVAGSDGSTFQIGYHAMAYQVSVASSCSGVNGVVGFALVGTAFGAVVRGNRVRKALWLATGLLLVWAFNLLRIMAIFWAGHVWGERFAIDGLHPVLGLVEFAAAVLVMVVLMPLARLTIPTQPTTTTLRERLGAVPRGAAGMRVAGVSLLAIVIVLFGVDGSLTRFQLTASDFGAPKVEAIDVQPAVVPGFDDAPVAEYDWVTRFFGSGSSWHRFAYAQDTYEPGVVGASQPAPVIADVIDSRSIQPFNAYGIEACYSFHGYTVHGDHTVDLGGVTGHALSYRDGAQSWTVVYWIWAVADSTGGHRYERVVLLEPSSAAGLTQVQPDANPLQGVGYSSPSTDSVGTESTDSAALVRFARLLVKHAAPAPTKATVSASRSSRVAS
jgi:exosortase